MLKETLLKLTRILKQNEIPYMVIGGYAVTYHGENRLTEDIDITLGVDIDYLDQLLPILRNEFTSRVKNVHNFVEKTNVLPIRDNHNSVKADLIFSFIDFERQAIEQAESLQLENDEIKIVSAEDLIIYKLISARERDIEDIKSVLDRKGDKIDFSYIDTHVEEMNELSGQQNINKIWRSLKGKNS